MRVKTLCNTNVVASRQVKEKTPHFQLPSVAQKRHCREGGGGEESVSSVEIVNVGGKVFCEKKKKKLEIPSWEMVGCGYGSH